MGTNRRRLLLRCLLRLVDSPRRLMLGTDTLQPHLFQGQEADDDALVQREEKKGVEEERLAIQGTRVLET